MAEWETNFPLKPCPFCGGEAKMHHWRCSYGNNDIYPFQVMCEDCKTRFGAFKLNQITLTEKEAAGVWNRRAEDGK